VHIFFVSDIKYRRSWQGRRSRWFHRKEYEPTLEIPFHVLQSGEGELVVKDDAGRPVARARIEATRGVNVFEWDLLLDAELALQAEGTRLAEREEQTELTWSDQPIAQALRLGWPLYIVPGEYTLELRFGDHRSERKITVEPADAPEARVKPDPPIRGKSDDDRP